MEGEIHLRTKIKDTVFLIKFLKIHAKFEKNIPFRHSQPISHTST